MAARYDVAVVGNGVVGLSVARALALREPGCRTVVVGPADRRGAATLAAGAMLGCFGEVTTLTLRSDAWREKLETGIAAAGLWADWRAQINEELPAAEQLPTHLGTHVITNARSGGSEDYNFAAIASVLQEYDEPHEEVDPHDIPGLRPMSGARTFRAIYLPREGWVPSHDLVRALESVNERRGVHTIEGWVDGLEEIDGGFRLTMSEGGDGVEAGQVVLAAGAYTQPLLEGFPEVRRKVPHVLAGVGTSLVLSHAEPMFESVVRSPNRAGACGIHAIPYPGGTFLGAANHLQMSPEVKPRVRFMTHLLRTGIEQLNGKLDDGFIERVQAGDRPVSLDGLPLVGETSVKGLWILTGTYRDGLQDSPLLAGSLASEMLGGDRLVSGSFRPERQPISVLPPAEVATEVAREFGDAFSEYSVALTPLLADMVDLGMEQLTEATQDRLGVDIGLHPDVFIMLVFNPGEMARVREWLTDAV